MAFRRAREAAEAESSKEKRAPREQQEPSGNCYWGKEVVSAPCKIVTLHTPGCFGRWRDLSLGGVGVGRGSDEDVVAKFEDDSGWRSIGTIVFLGRQRAELLRKSIELFGWRWFGF